MKQNELQLCAEAWNIHARMETEVNPSIQSAIYGELIDHRANCNEGTDPRVEHWTLYMQSQRAKVSETL